MNSLRFKNSLQKAFTWAVIVLVKTNTNEISASAKNQRNAISVTVTSQATVGPFSEGLTYQLPLDRFKTFVFTQTEKELKYAETATRCETCRKKVSSGRPNPLLRCDTKDKRQTKKTENTTAAR